MRDLMLLGMMCVIIPLCLRNAFAAYLLWGWSGLIAVQTFAYGFMAPVSYVMIFAVISLALIFLKRDPEMRPIKIQGFHILLFLFGAHTVLAATFAYPNLARNWEIALDLLKTLLFTFLMTCLVTSRLRVYALIWTIVLSAGYHGLLDGLKLIASAGAYVSQGNLKLGDRNHFAVLVTMAMPLILYTYWYARYRIVRLALLGVLFLNVLAVIATQSRAGLVSILAVTLYLILQTRRKVLGLFTVAVVSIAALAMAPAEWTSRMETIQSAGDDASFMGRVIAWKRSSAIALDNPVFGGGIRAVQDPGVYERFRYKQGLLGWVETPQGRYAAAAHSVYFEVMGDMGFVGLGIFMTVMLTPFFMKRRVARLSRELGPQSRWASDLLNMLCAAMVGVLVGGASISAAYFELNYMIAGLSVVVEGLLRRQRDEAMKAGVPRAAAVPSLRLQPA